MSKNTAKLLKKHQQLIQRKQVILENIRNYRLLLKSFTVNSKFLHHQLDRFYSELSHTRKNINKLKAKISKTSYLDYKQHSQDPQKVVQAIEQLGYALDFKNKKAQQEVSKAISKQAHDTLYLGFLDTDTPEELYRLGLTYLLGIGGSGSIYSAVFALERSAVKGYRRAKKLLDKVYHHNNNLPHFNDMAYHLYLTLQNEKTRERHALHYFLIALDLGHEKANARLKKALKAHHEEHISTISTQAFSTRKLYKMSIDFFLGISKTKHFNNALLCLQHSAKKGYKPAASLLKKVIKYNDLTTYSADAFYQRFQRLKEKRGLRKEALLSFIQAYYFNAEAVTQDIKLFSNKTSQKELLTYSSKDKSVDFIFQEAVAYLIGCTKEQNTNNAVKALIAAIKLDHEPSVKLLNNMVKYNDSISLERDIAAKLKTLDNCHLPHNRHPLFFKESSSEEDLSEFLYQPGMLRTF